MLIHEIVLESAHRHTEIIKTKAGDWVVYLSDHLMIRSLTRGIGPRMSSTMVSAVGQIHNLENLVEVGQTFWIQDINTNSSFFFKRLDIPGEPLAVRCETSVKDVPRAGRNTPVFKVNATPGPETKKDKQLMARAKLMNRFVDTNTMASNFTSALQRGELGIRGDHPENMVIRKPETQDSQRYDRAFRKPR